MQSSAAFDIFQLLLDLERQLHSDILMHQSILSFTDSSFSQINCSVE